MNVQTLLLALRRFSKPIQPARLTGALKAVMPYCLALQIALQPITPVHAKSEDEKTPLSAVEKARVRGDFAGIIGQELWTYELKEDAQGNQVDQVVSRQSLDRIDIRREIVGVADWSRQIRFDYDVQSRAFLIQKLIFNDKLNRYVVVNAHAIYGMELSNSSTNAAERLARSVIQDGNVVLISTTEGLVALYLPALRELAFNAPVPRFVIAPPASVAQAGARVEEIRFLNEKDAGRAMVDNSGQRTDLAQVHDVLMRTSLGNGQSAILRLDYGNEIIRPLALMELGHLVELLVASGDAELAGELYQIIRDPAQRQALLEYSRLRRNILIADENKNLDSDLLNSAIRSVALKFDARKRAGVLASDSQGQSRFDKLAQAPRDLVPVNSQKEFDQTLAQLDSSLPSDVKADFGSELVYATEHPSPAVREAKEKGSKLRKETFERLYQNVFHLAHKAATNKKLIFSLALALSGDIANIATDGAVMNTLLAQIGLLFGWTVDLPALGSVVKEIANQNAISYFHEKWALVSMVVGTGAVLSFRPLSYAIAKSFAKMKGHDWSEREAYFNLGMRIYAKANFPPQWFFWVKLLHQKNLYAGIENKVPVTNRALWNSPFNSTGSTEQAERKAEQLNTYLDEKAVANERALLIAAAIVSKEANQVGKPIDPTTLLELLTADRADRFDYFVNTLGSAKSEAAWTDLVEKTTAALAKLADRGAGQIDVESVRQYHNELVKLHTRFYKAAENNSKMARAVRFVHKKWLSFVSFTSKDVVNFLAFGLQGLKVYRALKDVRIDKRNEDTAAEQYDADYDLSTVYYAASAPNYFGAIGELITGGFTHVKWATEILMNQLEQIFIYGTLNGVDAMATHNADKGVTQEGFESEVNKTINRRASIKNGGAGKEISLLEAVGPMAKTFWDPADKAHVLKMWRAKMETTFSGFNARFLVGVVPRALGLMIIGAVGGGTIASVAQGVSAAVPKQANVMVNKLAFLGNSVGYATVWPVVLAFMNGVKSVIETNAELLELADYQIVTGLKHNRTDMVQQGVSLMQSLYYKGKETLPEHLKANVTDENLSTTKLNTLASELLEFSKQRPPLPSVKNGDLDWALNVLGAVVSTVLFTTLGHAMYDPDLAIMPQLVHSLTWFGITYMGVRTAIGLGPWIDKGTKAISEKATSAYDKVKASCANLLMKK